MEEKKVRFFQVKQKTDRLDGYAGMKYGGRIGRLKYDDPKRSMAKSGFPIVLTFDNFSDGFYEDEVDEVVIESVDGRE